MTRLTFGITSSPYLAMQVLRQVAQDHGKEFPRAAHIVGTTFYVDDCLTGAKTVEVAAEIREELNGLLDCAKMTLRKWRSNSDELLGTIPEALKEAGNLHLTTNPTECPKALGIYWNTVKDTLHVATPELKEEGAPTKCQVASAMARTFDILGWFTPATVTLKILLQKLWERKLGWDEIIPTELEGIWSAWKEELPQLTQQAVPRRLSQSEQEVIDRQLHSFCDTSTAAYGGVIYIRKLHADTSVSIALITAKTRVAPLSGLTIPRLELCGALLLSKLLTVAAADLNIPTNHIYAWSDSSVVLGWLNKTPTKSPVFIANRVKDILSRVSAEHWRYVATDVNPTDCASRGLLPRDLLKKELWWQGPPWLKQPLDRWPRRPDINLE